MIFEVYHIAPPRRPTIHSNSQSIFGFFKTKSLVIISDDKFLDIPPSITVSEELSTPIDPDDDEQYYKHFGVDTEVQNKG